MDARVTAPVSTATVAPDLPMLTIYISAYVRNNPSAFANAYFDIAGVRVYQ
jgi:hypothetical protein